MVSFVKSLWAALTAFKSFVTTLLFLILLIVLAPMLWRAITGDGVPIVHDKSALRLALDGVIVEQRSEPSPAQLLGGDTAAPQEILVSDVLDVLKRAATDKRITAVTLELDRFGGAGPANLEAIGAALDAVRKAGKPVIAYATAYFEPSYYLAAHASEVLLNPQGGVLLQGYGSYQLYLKGGLDKLKVDVNLFKAGRYKSFAEPYTRADMSADAREATASLLGALWEDYTTDVARARLPRKVDVPAYIDTMPTTLAAARGDAATVALKAGLVDRLTDEIGFRERMTTLVGMDEDNGTQDFRHIDWTAYATATMPSLDMSDDAIAVLYAVGPIIDGEQPAGSVGGDTLAGLVREAADDDSVKAIVLRIDSPGGSATASEKIRAELVRAQSLGKPVVASMGTVAASGGYWIAATSDAILAQPSTITGSIGVFGILPTFGRALDSLGVASDGVGTTPLSDAGDLARPLSPQVKQMLQLGIEHTYARFLTLVSNGRHISVAQADAAGQGRPWDGGTARQLKLVDRFGTLDDAVAEAAKRAGLKKWRKVVIEEPESLESLLLRKLGEMTGVQSRPATSAPAVLQQLVQLLQPLTPRYPAFDRRSHLAYCIECSALTQVGVMQGALSAR